MVSVESIEQPRAGQSEVLAWKPLTGRRRLVKKIELVAKGWWPVWASSSTGTEQARRGAERLQGKQRPPALPQARSASAWCRCCGLPRLVMARCVISTKARARCLGFFFFLVNKKLTAETPLLLTVGSHGHRSQKR